MQLSQCTIWQPYQRWVWENSSILPLYRRPDTDICILMFKRKICKHYGTRNNWMAGPTYDSTIQESLTLLYITEFRYIQNRYKKFSSVFFSLNRAPQKKLSVLTDNLRWKIKTSLGWIRHNIWTPQRFFKLFYSEFYELLSTSQT